jgi:hypothetical protein
MRLASGLRAMRGAIQRIFKCCAVPEVRDSVVRLVAIQMTHLLVRFPLTEERQGDPLMQVLLLRLSWR